MPSTERARGRDEVQDRLPTVQELLEGSVALVGRVGRWVAHLLRTEMEVAWMEDNRGRQMQQRNTGSSNLVEAGKLAGGRMSLGMDDGAEVDKVNGCNWPERDAGPILLVLLLLLRLPALPLRARCCSRCCILSSLFDRNLPRPHLRDLRTNCLRHLRPRRSPCPYSGRLAHHLAPRCCLVGVPTDSTCSSPTEVEVEGGGTAGPGRVDWETGRIAEESPC